MPVWQMLSSMALHANMQQQQTLVGELREKVLEGVVASKQRWGAYTASSRFLSAAADPLAAGSQQSTRRRPGARLPTSTCSCMRSVSTAV